MENELWRQAALVRFPRLLQIIALSTKEVSSFRSLFAAQHRVEASVLVVEEPQICPELNEFTITIEAKVDGTTVGTWTGMAADADDLVQGQAIRLWTDPPDWFNKSESESAIVASGVTIFVFVTRKMRTARFTPFGPLVDDLNLDDDANIEERYLFFANNVPRLLGTPVRDDPILCSASPDSFGVTLQGDGFVKLEMWERYGGEMVEESETFAAYFDKFVLEHGHGP
jgi:hypothetical protein